MQSLGGIFSQIILFLSFDLEQVMFLASVNSDFWQTSIIWELGNEGSKEQGCDIAVSQVCHRTTIKVAFVV